MPGEAWPRPWKSPLPAQRRGSEPRIPGCRMPLTQAGVKLKSANSAKPNQAPGKHIHSCVPATSVFSLPIFSAKSFIEEKGYISRELLCVDKASPEQHWQSAGRAELS